MACLYIQDQKLSVLKKVTWVEYAVMNKMWSQKSHPKAKVFLMCINKPECIIHCYTKESVMIAFS